MKNENDVVITGLGIVSPIGIGLSAFQDSLFSGVSGIKERTEFAGSNWPFRIAGTINDYEPKQYVKPRKSMKLMCREIQFGFGAATMAVSDAQLDTETVVSERFGVVCGTDTFYAAPSSLSDSFWNEDRSHREVSQWIPQAMKKIEPLWMLKSLPNMTASHVAIAMDARGPNNSLIHGDASGLLALVEAADVIRRDWADVMLVGGTGSKINPTYLAYHGVDDLVQHDSDPKPACRPFDQNRGGTVGAEGAGMIVLEKRKHAEARSARIYATVGGSDYGYCPPDQPDQQIEFQAMKISQAIERAGLSKDQISHVNSHASGEIEVDRVAACSIQAALGNVDVVAYKGFFGNAGPAGGILESCISINALHEDALPATLNCDSVAPDCPVSVLKENRKETQTAAVKTTTSDTGQMVAVVFEQDV